MGRYGGGMRRLVNMRLPVGLLAEVDERASGLGQTRTMFVERALKQALGGVASEPRLEPSGLAKGLASEEVLDTVAPSASARASEPAGQGAVDIPSEGERCPGRVDPSEGAQRALSSLEARPFRPIPKGK